MSTLANVPEGLRAVLGIALIILFLCIYFMPSVIAKGKRNWSAIFALNLLAGWTFAGWVIALVWALTKEK